LHVLAGRGAIARERVAEAIEHFGIDREKLNPAHA
jgi:pyruvate dehydrogenase complex dehydrogenase (E1) component